MRLLMSLADILSPKGKGRKLGPDACFFSYYCTVIVAIDGCTVRSGDVNVLMAEDEDIPKFL